jgi:hypothetical protein
VCAVDKKQVDGQVIETWTFRNRGDGEAMMQSGRSTTEPHAHVKM